MHSFLSRIKSISVLIPPLWQQGAIFISVLVAGGMVGWLLRAATITQSAQNGLSSMELRQSGYDFINPLLECNVAEEVGFSNYRATFEGAKEVIASAKESGRVTDAAVYFRDLNNGPWFSINEELQFEPASLFKLPLLITFYKRAERDPSFFDISVLVETEQVSIDQTNKPKKYAEVGKRYTVRQLVELMIVYSDNTATEALSQVVSFEEQLLILNDLGFEVTSREAFDATFQTSVRNYSSIFRLLYNGSYLSKQSSEEVLELLSRVEYADGLRRSIPNSIVISHKFGERGRLTGAGSGIFQLHDCGIVYYPRHPFLLCVMTKGSDHEQLPGVIQEITRSVYQEFSVKVGVGE